MRREEVVERIVKLITEKIGSEKYEEIKGSLEESISELARQITRKERNLDGIHDAIDDLEKKLHKIGVTASAKDLLNLVKKID